MSDQELYALIPELAGSEIPLRAGQGYDKQGVTLNGQLYQHGEVIELTQVSLTNPGQHWIVNLDGPRHSCPLGVEAEHIKLERTEGHLMIDLRKPLQRIRAGHILTKAKPLETTLGLDLFGYLSKAI